MRKKFYVVQREEKSSIIEDPMEKSKEKAREARARESDQDSGACDGKNLEPGKEHARVNSRNQE